jgi:arginine transport system substrate-binding protein
MKKLIFTTLLLLVSIMSPHLFAANIAVIHFATEATYPPFEFINAAGQIQGFDIDIAKALCKKMRTNNCFFSNQAFNSLIPSLKLGKFDAIISALGITQERQKQVAFTDSYYEPASSFIAPLAKHYTLAMIPGKIVGVQTGSTMEIYLQDKYGNKVQKKTYPSIQDAFLDLIAGRVDVVLADTPIANDWLKQENHHESYGIVDKPIVDAAHFGAGFGIAVRKDEKELLDALNKALVEIKKDGTYEKIYKQYFGT